MISKGFWSAVERPTSLKCIRDDPAALWMSLGWRPNDRNSCTDSSVKGLGVDIELALRRWCADIWRYGTSHWVRFSWVLQLEEIDTFAFLFTLRKCLCVKWVNLFSPRFLQDEESIIRFQVQKMRRHPPAKISLIYGKKQAFPAYWG